MRQHPCGLARGYLLFLDKGAQPGEAGSRAARLRRRRCGAVPFFRFRRPPLANRSYLYSLSNRPSAYEDRPAHIGGLAEWAYDVPFLFRLLMSADPQLCASLISKGLDGDEPGRETTLYAISASFEPGFARVCRLAALLQQMAAAASPAEAAAEPAAPGPVSLFDRVRRRFGAPVPAASSAPAAVPAQSATGSAHVAQWAEEMRAFLEQRRDDYLLLETIELDVMSEGEGEALRACVEAEMARCRQVGAAFEALPADAAQAIGVLRQAAAVKQPPPMDAFFGLRFDDDCDSTRNGATAHPLGLTGWSEVLYYELLDRAGFEARQSEH